MSRKKLQLLDNPKAICRIETRFSKKNILSQLYWVDSKTLTEIGLIYGVTRERIRQVFVKLGISTTRRRNHKSEEKYKSLDNYLTNRDGKSKLSRENTYILRRLLPVIRCNRCSSSDFLCIHHNNYPAHSQDDLEVLCKSCHTIEHNGGIDIVERAEIVAGYEEGDSAYKLAEMHNTSRVNIHRILRIERAERPKYYCFKCQQVWNAGTNKIPKTCSHCQNQKIVKVS